MKNSTSYPSSTRRPEQHRSAIYGRSATGDRASLDRQLQRCANYCSQVLGSTPVVVFEDSGKSGMSRTRPGLNRLVSAIRSGQVTDVIVEDMARLARSLTYEMDLLELCRTNSVIVHQTVQNSPVLMSDLVQTEAERNRNRLVQLMAAGKRRMGKTKRDREAARIRNTPTFEP